jgi:hypothetical protein
VVDEGVESVRPGVLVDVPVAEAGPVVAAVAEPAVVQDETLHADFGAEVGQVGEAVEVVVEVDGLPGVEHHRAWPLGVSGAGAQVLVEAGGQAVQTLVAVGGVQPRAGVLLAGAEDPLAG